MKKLIPLFVFLTLLSMAMQAQTAKPYPIPSFKVAVDSGYARFEENAHLVKPDTSREKRDAHVKIIRNGPSIQPCQAQVWLYSLDGLDVLGPYTVACGATLTVEIDGREWGVLVQTSASVLVDVWIE
ncbi:MAG: hypothetical protein WCK84_12500 [Bacteroidota bacterium]